MKLVSVAEVYFFNSYTEYIHNSKYSEETYDEHFTVIDKEIDKMDSIIWEKMYKRILERKLNYFKIVESYKLVED